MNRFRLGVILVALSVWASGCASEVVIPHLVAIEFAEDDEPFEAIIIFLGFMNITEPCEFSIDISFAGEVSEFRRSNGSLPPGYSLVSERIAIEGSSTNSVTGRIRGPAVGPGLWTSEVAAVGSAGEVLSTRTLTLSCATRYE